MAKYYRCMDGKFTGHVYILATKFVESCKDGTMPLIDLHTGEAWSTLTTFGESGATFEEVQKVDMTFKKVCVVEFKI